MLSKLIKIVAASFMVLLLANLPAYAEGSADLINAVTAENVGAVQSLIDQGADVNAKTFYYGETALMWAVERGNSDILGLLLDAGAEVNTKNSFGETALMYAAKKGNLDTVQLLLKRAADVNAQDKNGWTALMYAAFIGNNKVASLLKNVASGSIPEWVQYADSELLDEAENNDSTSAQGEFFQIMGQDIDELEAKDLLVKAMTTSTIAQR